VIDFGDITAGDPATDVAVAWIVLDESGRDRFRDLVAADDATWTRAEAWALSFAVMYLDSRDTDPVMGRMGEHTLTQVLAGQKT
jgi:aminoglycoside phosphotransferase (APT) family kinase protein